MKTGSHARLIQPEIRGQVRERRINPATDELELLLEFTDADGQLQQRWCQADQLEEIAP